MSFDKKILSSVLKDLRDRRLRRETEAAVRRNIIYDELPRIADIDIELKTTALDIIKSTFNSKNNAESMLAAVRDKNLALQAERAELLVKAGYQYDHLEPHYDCSRCCDTGYIEAQPCSCLIKLYSKLQAAELNKVFAVGADGFDGFNLEYYSKDRRADRGISPYEQAKEVYNYCLKYANDFENRADNIFMTGASGLGKTHIANCIARAVAASSKSVVYDTAFSTLAAYEADKFSRDVAANEGGTRRYQDCDLLVIDDLGSELITAFTLSALYHLINLRLLTGKNTIIISTLSLADIKKKYNDQIYSRIANEYVELNFFGDDIREIKKFKSK